MNIFILISKIGTPESGEVKVEGVWKSQEKAVQAFIKVLLFSRGENLPSKEEINEVLEEEGVFEWYEGTLITQEPYKVQESSFYLHKCKVQ